MGYHKCMEGGCTRPQWQALKRLQDRLLHILTAVHLWCSLDNSIIIWDPAKGQKLTTLEGHKSYVKGIAWDPIGKYLASQSDDRTVKVGGQFCSQNLRTYLQCRRRLPMQCTS